MYDPVRPGHSVVVRKHMLVCVWDVHMLLYPLKTQRLGSLSLLDSLLWVQSAKPHYKVHYIENTWAFNLGEKKLWAMSWCIFQLRDDEGW